MGAMAGNAIEWFDYGIYGYLTGYLSSHIFGDTENATLWTLFGFAVSFLIRPIGGAVLGPLGDRIGRQKVLVFTILMISLSTFCIGLLPTFDMIGWWSPILLFTLRIIQGFSAGGEYAGAAVYMAEHAPDNRRGFWGSFLEFGTLLGFSGAAILVTAMTAGLGEEFMNDWGWRIPFFITLPLGLFALWMRYEAASNPRRSTELEAAGEAKSSAWKVLVDLIKQQPKQLLKIMGLVILINSAFYLVLTYMPTYLDSSLEMDRNDLRPHARRRAAGHDGSHHPDRRPLRPHRPPTDPDHGLHRLPGRFGSRRSTCSTAASSRCRSSDSPSSASSW